MSGSKCSHAITPLEDLAVCCIALGIAGLSEKRTGLDCMIDTTVVADESLAAGTGVSGRTET